MLIDQISGPTGLVGMRQVRSRAPKPNKAYADAGWPRAGHSGRQFLGSGSQPKNSARWMRSMYGTVHCVLGRCGSGLSMTNGEGRAVSDRTADALSEYFGDGSPESRHLLMQQPHILNSNLLLENTHENRELMRAWLTIALTKPDAFCASHTQDQAVWSILSRNRSLPLLNLCPYFSATHSRCNMGQKALDAIWGGIKRGDFDVTDADARQELATLIAGSPPTG